MRTVGLVLAGILASLVGLVTGFGMAGFGEGWLGGLVLALPLFALYPVTAVLVFNTTKSRWWAEIVLLLTALLLDVYLCRDIIQEWRPFRMILRESYGFLSAWLALWLGWQALVFVPLFRRIRARFDPRQA